MIIDYDLVVQVKPMVYGTSCEPRRICSRVGHGSSSVSKGGYNEDVRRGGSQGFAFAGPRMSEGGEGLKGGK